MGNILDDQHRNTNMKDKDHLVGQLTNDDADDVVNDYCYYNES